MIRPICLIPRAYKNFSKVIFFDFSILFKMFFIDNLPNLLSSNNSDLCFLSEKMSEIAAKLILNSLKLIESNKANFIKQEESVATYANKIQKNESQINWDESAKKIIAKINALHPNPGCWFKLYETRIKIIKAIEIERTGKVGTIIDNNMTIACSKNSVQILELKKEGKKQMLVEEYLKGNDIKIGQRVN